jgi:hypothetical protein
MLSAMVKKLTYRGSDEWRVMCDEPEGARAGVLAYGHHAGRAGDPEARCVGLCWALLDQKVLKNVFRNDSKGLSNRFQRPFETIPNDSKPRFTAIPIVSNEFQWIPNTFEKIMRTGVRSQESGVRSQERRRAQSEHR